jgi:arylsulfatase
MEAVEEELIARSLDFIERSVKAGKPFFLWHNSTRMHIWTRLSPKWTNKSGYGLYADGMMELDDVVGRLLAKLDDLGIADNTIVVFTTDNGAEIFSWPDGGNTPFHGEKATTWEGGMRAPCLARWPGILKPGSIHNEVMAAEDWMPTLVAAAGDPDVTQKLLKGYAVGGKTFKNHLDGYNFLPFFKGQAEKPPRREIFYFDDNANLNAIRVDDWKITFKYLDGTPRNGVLKLPFFPVVVNLRQDPFERYYGESLLYDRWAMDKLWMCVPAQVIVGKFVESFKEYPPSQRSGSFTVDQVLEALQTGAAGTSK